MKIKKSKTIYKYLDLARELKKLRDTVMLIIVGALGTVSKGLKKKWRNRKSEEKSTLSKP